MSSSFNAFFRSRTMNGIKTTKGVFNKDSRLRNSKTLFFTFLNIDRTTAGLVPDIKDANIKARKKDFTPKINIVNKVKKIRFKHYNINTNEAPGYP